MENPHRSWPRRLAGRLTRRLHLSRAEKFWSSAFEAGGIETWLAEPRVRQHANQQITGSPHEWPVDCFKRLYVSKPFEHALSVGCGEGALERDLRKKDICWRATGIDLSRSALKAARAAAARDGILRIRYRRADFNTFKLRENHHDLVFFHQSLHHVANLEHCLGEVEKTLTPGGFLYLDEYVGPSRDEWNDELLEPACRVYLELPEEVRKSDRIPLPIEVDDPSEAIRSSEIVPMVRERFTVLHQRDYGGNVLALVHPLIRWEILEPRAKDELLEALIREERSLLDAGATSLYTVILATHDGGLPAGSDGSD